MVNELAEERHSSGIGWIVPVERVEGWDPLSAPQDLPPDRRSHP